MPVPLQPNDRWLMVFVTDTFGARPFVIKIIFSEYPLTFLLELLSSIRYVTIYMVRSVAWMRSIWRMPKPI